MPQKVKQEDDLEGLLVSILGILIVMGGAATVYFLIARAMPFDFSAADAQKDPLSKWIWLVFGTFFFLYGRVEKGGQ